VRARDVGSGVATRMREAGVVLVVALIAMVAMAFSGLALVRVVDTTAAIAGNMAFRHSAAEAPDAAIEEAVAALFEQRLIATTDADDRGHSYFASRGVGEDARGVPAALAQIANYPGEARILDAGGGNTVRYVIERMCVAPGPATRDNCTLIPSTDAPLTVGGGNVVEPPRVPLFRQTVRVDGPAGTTLFVQAWLADVAGRRRLSWRAIAD
jgi:type IV pilus assembly protein PilX